MIALEILKSDKFQSRPVIRDNFNRESSACFSKRGAVIHSGTFRSTAFVSVETPLFPWLKYWVKQEQSALDAWIDCVVGEREDTADKAACIASRPLWKFTAQTRKGFEHVTATRKDGALTLKLSAHSWREIHYLTR